MSAFFSKSVSEAGSAKKVALVGSPNVGKSSLFNRLTGYYVTVANYPGTTVEVSNAEVHWEGQAIRIMDTPGMYSLNPLQEEEHVARQILLDSRMDVILHVVDAKNLKRMLPLTLQLIQAGLPVALVLNMMDEARRYRITIETEALSKLLGIPVLPIVSVTGEGIEAVRKLVLKGTHFPVIKPVRLTPVIESAIHQLEDCLSETPLSKRMTALLLLEEEETDEIWNVFKGLPPEVLSRAKSIINDAKKSLPTLEMDVAMAFQREAGSIADKVFHSGYRQHLLYRILDTMTLNPWTAFPLALAILYFVFYKFVGDFGAGTVVDFLEGRVFESYLNPLLTGWVQKFLPWSMVQDLFIGEYGIFTLGIKYAFALILPIVTFYFLAFALIEDVGYLPRLAMMMDRAFKKIGLSGRAVIPMVLGFGCDTMATMVTRTLPTLRERIISTILLSLAIPCSAQLGVIFAVLSGHPQVLLAWLFVMVFVFIFIGFLSSRILPGEKPSFYLEIPPLRLPHAEHIFIKTYSRVRWYFAEVLPLFILASVLIWIGNVTGILTVLIRALEFPTRWIGLPDVAAKMFLMGFFRRDYGAAGLYDMAEKGLMNPSQLLVACIALTLFIPCIAQFLMTVKERGWKTGVSISVFTLVFSFGVAYAVHRLLEMGVWTV